MTIEQLREINNEAHVLNQEVIANMDKHPGIFQSILNILTLQFDKAVEECNEQCHICSKSCHYI